MLDDVAVAIVEPSSNAPVVVILAVAVALKKTMIGVAGNAWFMNALSSSSSSSSLSSCLICAPSCSEHTGGGTINQSTKQHTNQPTDRQLTPNC